MSKVRTQLVIDGQNNTRRSFKEVNDDLKTMDDRLRTAGRAISTYFSVQALTGALRGIARISDGWVEMTDRLKIATDGQGEYGESLTRIRAISDRTFTSMANNAELFINSLKPLRERGFSTNEILNFTEAVNLGLVASATKGQAAEAVIQQVSRAMQTGVLRGDAFNAVIEKTPALAEALAKGLGVTRQELIRMAQAGELTSERVIPALNSQLDSLGEAVDGMNVTVEDAMTRLKNAFDEAIGQTDMTPLIEAIGEVQQVLSDPQVVENLVRLTTAIVNLGALTIKAGSSVVGFGDDLGYIASRVLGSVSDLDRANKEIEKLEAASTGFGMLDLYMSDAEIERRLKAWKDYRDGLVAQMTGMTREMQALSDAANAADEEAKKESQDLREAELASYRQYLGELRTLQESQVKAAEDAAKKLVAVERTALRDLEKVREDRKKIDERYDDALFKLRGGGSGDPSFLSATELRGQAQRALNAGDLDRARKLAQQSLETLIELQSQGANTYGFEGVASSLRQIELAANDIEETRAAEKLAGIREQMASLQEQAQLLEDAPVSFEMDEASVNAVRDRIAELAQQLGQDLVIPVRLTNPAGSPSLDIPGFATGTSSAPPGLAWVGEMGPELINLRGGERIYNADESARIASGLVGGGDGFNNPAVIKLPGGRELPVMAQAGALAELADYVRRENLKRR